MPKPRLQAGIWAAFGLKGLVPQLLWIHMCSYPAMFRKHLESSRISGTCTFWQFCDDPWAFRGGVSVCVLHLGVHILDYYPLHLGSCGSLCWSSWTAIRSFPDENQKVLEFICIIIIGHWNWLNAMSVDQNNTCRFFPKVYDLSSHSFLAW